MIQFIGGKTFSNAREYKIQEHLSFNLIFWILKWFTTYFKFRAKNNTCCRPECKQFHGVAKSDQQCRSYELAWKKSICDKKFIFIFSVNKIHINLWLEYIVIATLSSQRDVKNYYYSISVAKTKTLKLLILHFFLEFLKNWKKLLFSLLFNLFIVKTIIFFLSNS